VEQGSGDGETERIPIEKNLVGLIIGRAGENLRRVEQTTGARVQFKDGPDSSASFRNCDISGSRSARASAKAEIYRTIDENGPGNRASGQDRSKPPAKVEMGEPQLDDENGTQIMVPDRTVGLIIGRGGETIRDLQERSGCHVNIVAENKSINGLRPVNLIGSEQAQQNAKDLIMEIVESDTRNVAAKQDAGRPPPRDDPYNSGGEKMTDSMMVPGDAVGMIIGRGTFSVMIGLLSLVVVRSLTSFQAASQSRNYKTRRVARSTYRSRQAEISNARLA
jgi:far upstream element-binding protein